MLKSPLLFALSVLVGLISWTGIAKANDTTNDTTIGLTFTLPPTSPIVEAPPAADKTHSPEPSAPATLASQPSVVTMAKYEEPLPPLTAEEPLPPLTASESKASENQASGNRPSENRDTTSIGVHFAETTLQVPQAESPSQEATISLGEEQTLLASDNHGDQSIVAMDTPAIAYNTLGLDDWIFEGGPNSLVAHTVGSAEGTRRWDGRRTKAYYGHKDPGNGVWNLGTFSYQHEANDPEEADEKQLKRLKNQGFQLEKQASHLGLKLSLEEKLNGLDLANQAPLAALGKGGYIERLRQAYRLEMQGFEAISWARTRAYIDPDTKVWNAPGLGNNLYSISQDQERRMAAIDKALRAYDRNGMAQIALSNLDHISLENTTPSSTNLEPTWDDALQYVVTDSTDRDIASPVISSRTTESRPLSISALEFGLPISTNSGNIIITEDSHDDAYIETVEIANSPELTHENNHSLTQPESATLPETNHQQPLQKDPLDLHFATTTINLLPTPSAEQGHQHAAASPESLLETEPSAVLDQVMGEQHRQDDAAATAVTASPDTNVTETNVAHINPIATTETPRRKTRDNSASAIAWEEAEEARPQSNTTDEEPLATTTAPVEIQIEEQLDNIATQSEDNLVTAKKIHQDIESKARRWFSIRIEDKVIENK